MSEHHRPASKWRGILLAAGSGRRFDQSGQRNKLLQPVNDNMTVAVGSAHNLLAVLPDSLAVLPEIFQNPSAGLLAQSLRDAGCHISICAHAGQGMAASLVHGLQQSLHYQGWIIALADMPYVQASSIRQLLGALESGADIATLCYQGKRGNPVAFSRTHLAELLMLTGDQGARNLLQRYPVTEIEVDDPGILRDIDHPQDLMR
ncbi:nucleotidyltransferase family protein [Undibacterium sp. Jales W-56]|uniref:nucleotidyltransferase family protein n=1 Tax=Undibacterium sp. Jales W-56 TaxID=2897325 RepID=UPI0021D084C8|nr:nucleotidyltransferase family protein [Undibacterium sp. Jales W-56]MCU6435149.1 nucleotidyltransferase family protein [Undibacterium sp. Jales W-56]